MRTSIDPTTLRELLRYDAGDGVLYWRERDSKFFQPTEKREASGHAKWWNGRFAGKRACKSDCNRGYLRVCLFGDEYPAHRVIWAMETGQWPTNVIDHIDGDPANNRIANLRPATTAENNRNKANHGRSRFRGVSWRARQSIWVSAIKTNKRVTFLGCYKDEEDAARAYDVAAIEQHGNFARTNFPRADYEARIKSALVEVPADAGMREAFVRVLASLAAAISILERTPKAKRAVASDKMFDQMLDDYRKALEAGRSAITAPDATTKSDGGEPSSRTAGGFPVAAAPYHAEETGVIQPTRERAGIERGMDQGVTGGESATTTLSPPRRPPLHRIPGTSRAGEVRMNCYIFDIDGTLADCSHRLHHIQKQPKDWTSFFADCHGDAPISHMIELAQTLRLASAKQIVFVSGRSDECRADTERWLAYHVGINAPLYMRKAGDYRDDDIIKVEILSQVRADGYEPIMAFDDRNRVVAAWRAAGVPCAQVAPGDF